MIHPFTPQILGGGGGRNNLYYDFDSHNRQLQCRVATSECTGYQHKDGRDYQHSLEARFALCYLLWHFRHACTRYSTCLHGVRKIGSMRIIVGVDNVHLPGRTGLGTIRSTLVIPAKRETVRARHCWRWQLCLSVQLCGTRETLCGSFFVDHGLIMWLPLSLLFP